MIIKLRHQNQAMPKSARKRKVTLVICIDRDDDLGAKAGVKGPIIGRKENLAAANRLALKDPADSDVNALFKAIQVLDRLREKDVAELVTLTGDPDVGMASDRKIGEQLDQVLAKYDVSESVLVTDGAEDEYVLPLIKTKIGVVYNERIIVKQSQQLENMYYVIYDFMLSILADPKASRIFVGLPALALILYAIFGAAGGRLIVGVVGAYLLVKGFQLEKFVEGIYSEAAMSFRAHKLSFFMYFSSLVPAVIGIVNGYRAAAALASSQLYLQVSAFLQEAVIMFFISAVLVGMGGMLGTKKQPLPSYLGYFSISFSIAWIIYEITRVILREIATYNYLLYAIAVSSALIFVSSFVERRAKIKK